MARALWRARTRMALVASAGLLALTGCAQDALEDGDAAEQPTGGGEVVIGHQNYTEMKVMAEIYAALLEDAGYQPTLKGVATRDLYVGPLSEGTIDVVPEYASSMTEFLNREQNGPDAEPVASPDVEETVAQLEELGSEMNIVPLEAAVAEDANAFAVTSEFAEEHDLETLSDLGELDQPIDLAAAEDCPDRPDCLLGLEEVYGIEIGNFVPLGFGTVQTKDALTSGEVQLGQVGTSDASVKDLGLVVLEDDKDWQNAENLVPVVNAEFLEQNPDVADVLNELSDTLTTEHLADLNAAVDLERKLPGDVAQQYLEEQGLL